MDLAQHYDKLYEHAIEQFQSDSYQVDKLIDSTSDKRFGITLVVRPSQEVKSRIKKMLDNLQEVEPKQYFYPESDMHITVMSIISCYDGFKLSQIEIEEYIKTIQESLSGLSPFDIDFNGLTASPSCLMVHGFFHDNTLNQIRDNLRANFRKTGLEQSLDKRYAIQTAHSTIFRLREEFSNKEKFLETTERYKDCYFGTFKVDTVELVFNDWYQRERYVKKLYEFKLN